MTASLYQSGSEVFGTAVIELLIRGSAASLPCSCARGRSAHVVLASVMMFFHAKDVAWLATEDDRKHEPSEVYRIPLHDPSPTPAGRTSAQRRAARARDLPSVRHCARVAGLATSVILTALRFRVVVGNWALGVDTRSLTGL